MTTNQLFTLAALRTGRQPAEVREIFSAVSEIIHEQVARGEHVQARPLAVFYPADTGKRGRAKNFEARPVQRTYPEKYRKEVRS